MTNIKIRCVSLHAPNEDLEVTVKLVDGLILTKQYELVKIKKPKNVLENVEKLAEVLDDKAFN